MTLDEISEVSGELISLVYREYLRKAFSMISEVIVATGNPPWEKAEDSIPIIEKNMAKIQNAANILNEITKGILKIKQHKILFDALKNAGEILEKHNKTEETDDE